MMDQNARRKIFSGGRVRKLRSELGLSQSAMAGELGISLSYLNLIERNQRPLTAQLLIKLSESYSIDARSFAQEEDIRAAVAMEEVFSDPIFQQSPISRSEIGMLAEDAPEISEAIKQLYQAFVELRDLQMAGSDKPSKAASKHSEDPIEQTRIFFEKSGNYFPILEKKAEEICTEMQAKHGFLFEAIVARLRLEHGVTVQIVAVENMRKLIRHYDRHRKRLMISELADANSRTFHAAFHLGLLEAGSELDALSLKASAPETPVQKLTRINLCSYFAAAIMMPYDAFFEAAKSNAYDIEFLQSRFSSSFEQVAHRLTTLGKPGKRGIPFFMLRVDEAGNISKRLATGAFPFSRYGGTCPKWNIYKAFHNSVQILRDIVELPDGGKWFSLAKAVGHNVIGLGCDMKFANQIMYSKGLDLKVHNATPIGINCKLCERPDCAQRAAPPLMRKLFVTENSKGISMF
jgi:XRE family transcriptional regulator, fatty acid utilization regulator